MGTIRTLACVAVLLGVAACGDTLGEQAAIGAAAGGGAAAATKNDLLTGAVLGAAGNIAYCSRYPSRC